MVDYPFSPEERRFLESLLRHEIRFMIVGLSAAAIQGAPVVTQDVDIWFANPGERTFQPVQSETGVSYIPPDGSHPPMFVGAGAELFDIVVYMHGLGSFDQEWQETITIPFGPFHLHVLKLERIIESKRALGRPRDKLVVPVLEDSLRVLKERGENSDAAPSP